MKIKLGLFTILSILLLCSIGILTIDTAFAQDSEDYRENLTENLGGQTEKYEEKLREIKEKYQKKIDALSEKNLQTLEKSEARKEKLEENSENIQERLKAKSDMLDDAVGDEITIELSETIAGITGN
ncbi:MAG: hypothetical protein OEL51_04755 [Nitrosopumilus sp.]|nr:hypothetical protein [Nitrosopumilus sp.]MDH3516807.1 hypothetical protein [Nitrosopumilus sp.]MDH3565241.1 hypothetical protein [Nitrosopumilus sp.]MDH5555076.1 hypothetical protein [Nitrosopumilus sp.]